MTRTVARRFTPSDASSAQLFTSAASVSFNIVQNTMNVGTMTNSPVQQGGIQSAQNQAISYTLQDIAELNRLVTELAVTVTIRPREFAL